MAGPETKGEDTPLSLLGGIKDCVVDEVMALVQLLQLLIEIRADLDLAADGVVGNAGFAGAILDNMRAGRFTPNLGSMMTGWVAELTSTALDASSVIELLEQVDLTKGLPAGMTPVQFEALVRLKVKTDMLRQAIEAVSRDTVDFLAAYDLHISTAYIRVPFGGLFTNSDRKLTDRLINIKAEDLDLILPSHADAVIGGIADVVSLFYSSAEWQARGQAGLGKVQAVIDKTLAKVRAEPWGTAGYLICTIILMFIPGKALLSVVTKSWGILRRTGKVADLLKLNPADIVKEAMDDVPSPQKQLDEVTPDTPATKGEHPDAPEAKPAKDPSKEQAPDPDGNTSDVKGDKRTDKQKIGDLAEADIRKQLEADGYEVIDISRGKNGIDVTAVKLDMTTTPPTLRQLFGEVKANGSGLSLDQSLGGAEYTRIQLTKASTEKGFSGIGRLKELIENAQDAGYHVAPPEYRLYSYENVTPDGISGPGKSTPWTPGSKAYEFKLDAQGKPIQRKDASGNLMFDRFGNPIYEQSKRVWTPLP